MNSPQWFANVNRIIPKTVSLNVFNRLVEFSERDPTKGELGSKLMLVSDKNIHVPLKELCEKITFCDNVAKILTMYMLIKRLYR